ncbi:aldehyde dehydrogenase [Phytoactinopolyspora mesophila]|uniref:Aldehyde dehydrogenase family protein n=1 Tax=Phytoactinopolyspora mesophila TaxID=2650750 RepID=A0A7K3LZK6_9ACTN|nr:aldehyde dehydrogenase [Phytoactinopolyspora mesophila]NDL56473.1 aldehyde dehydrogenase family protein [Phytoactinopolyspora mesophila]
MHIRHLIDGHLVDSADGQIFDDVTPIDNTVVATVALGGAGEVDQAVGAARRAFGSWSRTPVQQRRFMLDRIADAIDARADELAELDTRDMGAPISDTAAITVPKSAEVMRFFGAWAENVSDEAYHRPELGVLSYTAREPLGVVAAIAPWNQPLLAMAWKLAPALAFGCTVVMKPAEQSPVTATVLAEICRDAGVPDGVVNVVHGFGPGSVGEALVRHPDVDGVAFTGASATGKALMAAGSSTLKRLSLELGGKSANIVCADADLDQAVPGSALAAFNNAGQICVAGSRALVHRSIYDEYLERLLAEARSWAPGDPLDPKTRLGPLVSTEQYERVVGYIDIARQEGATVLLGGGRPSAPELDAGNYVEPTVLADVDNSMRCVREEIFGPVLAVMPFDDLDEAIRIANDTPYGLAGMLWTQSLETAQRTAREVRAGNFWVNTFAVRDRRAPFGGFKESGIGREGGDHSREFYTEPKAVYLKTLS